LSTYDSLLALRQRRGTSLDPSRGADGRLVARRLTDRRGEHVRVGDDSLGDVTAGVGLKLAPDVTYLPPMLAKGMPPALSTYGGLL
jgi:hypothetical protein